MSAKSLRQEFVPTLRLALPLAFAELGWMSMGIVDTIMVGRLPNSAIAIGATGLGETLYNMLAIFAAGLLLGMDTFVAQAFGRADLKDARRTLVNGLVLALIIAPILMLIILTWPPLMLRCGISPELVGPMTPFLRALNWGSLPLLIYFALRRYLQAVNVVNPIMFALISANLINIAGDWALIYGHLGFPAMGIVGSGWSTCFARVYLVVRPIDHAAVGRIQKKIRKLERRSPPGPPPNDRTAASGNPSRHRRYFSKSAHSR